MCHEQKRPSVLAALLLWIGAHALKEFRECAIFLAGSHEGWMDGVGVVSMWWEHGVGCDVEFRELAQTSEKNAKSQDSMKHKGKERE